MLAGVLRHAGAAVKLTQAKVAVGDERPHAACLGERQSLPIVSFAAFGVEPVGMGRNISEQMQRMRRKARQALRGFDRANGQAPGFVELAEELARSAQRAIGPTPMLADFP